MKTALLVGAVPYSISENLLQQANFIIAADGGYENLKAVGKYPDLLVGDFDSLSAIPSHIPILRHPVRKDDTDISLAISLAKENGCDRMIFCGCLGGKRPDHTYANLQLLASLAKDGVSAVFLDETYAVTAISNTSLRFSCQAEGVVSVFSHTDRSDGVTLKHLSYPLENGSLTSIFPLGVSNAFVGKEAAISVQKGTLLIFFPPHPEWLL